jgi:hypothetical protein
MIKITTEQKFLFERAAREFSKRSQMIVAIEELAELQVELAKVLNGKRDMGNTEHAAKLIDELADATIMIGQTIHNLSLAKSVDLRIFEKLSRLNNLLDDRGAK